MTIVIFLAEPSAEDARQQEIALRELEGLELRVVTYPHPDALDEAERLQPDMVILRHERPGVTGFALAARFRKSAVLRAVPMLITTSDATRDQIDRHRASPGRADFYLTLPWSLAELEETIRMLAARARDKAALMDAAGGGPVDPPRLPSRAVNVAMPWVQSGLHEVALPAPGQPSTPFDQVRRSPAPEAAAQQGDGSGSEFDAGGQLPQPALGHGGQPEITLSEKLPRPLGTRPPPSIDPTDQAFVERLFNASGGLDSPPELTSPGGARSGGDSPDAKLIFLRDKLRERERDLARLSRIWKAKEFEIRNHESRVHAKESEVESYLVQMNELSREVKRLQQQLAEKDREMGASVEGLVIERVMLEKDLIEAVAGKEKELFALKRERTSLEAATEALKQQLVARIYEWEAAYRELDLKLQATVATGTGTLVETFDLLDGTRVSLRQARQHTVTLESRIAILTRKQEEDRAEQKTLLRAIETTRHALAFGVKDLATRDRLHRAELKQAQEAAERTQLELELLLHQTEAARTSWRDRLLQVQCWLVNGIQARDAEIHRFKGMWVAERDARVGVEDLLLREQTAAEQLIQSLDDELVRSRAEVGALNFLRNQERASKEDQLHTLKLHLQRLSDDVKSRELKVEEVKDVQASLHAEIKRLEESAEAAVKEREGRISQLEQRLLEETNRVVAISEKRAGLERTVATRDSSIKELSDKLDAAAEHQAATEATLREAESQIRTLSLRLEDRERGIQQRDQQLVSLRNELNTLQAEAERLATELQRREEELNVKGLEAKNLEASLHRKVAEIEDLETTRQQMAQNQGRTDAQLTGVKQKLNEALNTINARETQIKSLAADVQRLTEELHAAQRSNEDQRMAMGQLEATLQKADEDAAAGAGRERALSQQVEAERAEAARLRAEINTRDAVIADVKAKLQAAQRQKSDVDAQITALRQDLEGREQAAGELRTQLETLRQALGEKTTELDGRQHDLTRLDGRIQALQQEIEGERKQVAVRTAERDKARDDLAAMTAEMDTERSTAREQQSQIARLNATLASAQEAQQHLAGRSGQQSRTLTETQAEIHRLSEALGQRDQALRALETRFREQQEVARQRDQEMEQIQVDLVTKTTLVTDLLRVQSEHEQLHAQMLSDVDGARRERDELQEKFFEVEQKLKAAEASAASRGERLKVAVAAEAQLREELSRTVQEGQKTLRESEERGRKLREELATMRKERDEQTLIVQQMTQNVRSLEEAHKEQERARASLQTRETAASKQLAEIRARMTQLEKAHADLTLQHTNLQQELAESRGSQEATSSARSTEGQLRQRALEERMRAEAALKDRTEQLEALQVRFDEARHEIERFVARVNQESELRTTLETTLNAEREQLESAQKDAQERAAQNTELERARSQLQAKAIQLERKVGELQKQATTGSSSFNDQMAQLTARMETQAQIAANEKMEFTKRIQDLEAVRTKTEAAVRQALDEKENLRRHAARRVQQSEEKVKELEARLHTVEQSASTSVQNSKEVEALRQEAAKARVERDAIRKEATSRIQALQQRAEKLTKALRDAKVPVPPTGDSALPVPPIRPLTSSSSQAPVVTDDSDNSPTMIASPFKPVDPSNPGKDSQ